jgi:hypothetical protein
MGGNIGTRQRSYHTRSNHLARSPLMTQFSHYLPRIREEKRLQFSVPRFTHHVRKKYLSTHRRPSCRSRSSHHNSQIHTHLGLLSSREGKARFYIHMSRYRQAESLSPYSTNSQSRLLAAILHIFHASMPSQHLSPLSYYMPHAVSRLFKYSFDIDHMSTSR